MMAKCYFKRVIVWVLCFAVVLTAVLPILPPVHAFNISSGELASPGGNCSTPGTHYFTLKSLPLGTAVQDFAISGDYIYATQRVSSTSGDIYISRCRIDWSTGVPYNATHDSHMIITNAGYGESLDIFTYGGTTYLLTGLYAQNNGTNDRWSLQIGRLAYKAGATYAHSQIHRFKSLQYSGLRADESKYAFNTLAKLNGDIDRVNACVGDTYTVFRIQMSVLRSGEKKCGIFYAYFDTNALFGLIASSESYDFDNGNTSATAHRNAHIDTFYQCEENVNLVLPNYGFQGMEATDGKNIYVAGGNDGEAPKIARMNGSTYANLCSITGIGNTEIQGLHYQDHHLYFASTTGGDATNRNWQKIYRASTCIAGYGGHSATALNGYAANCTAAGRTNGTKCTRCGDILSGYEVIPALNHSFNNGTVTKAASGMTDGTMTISCTRGDHSFTIPIPSVNIPLSYAKPLQANLLNKVAYSNGSDTAVTGTQLASLTFADTSDQSLATAELYNSSGGTPNSFLFKPNEMLSKIIRINSNILTTVSHTTSGVTYSIPATLPVPIQIVPATSVYYETDFSNSVFTQQMKASRNTWSTSGESQEEIQCVDLTSSVLTYGYEASYADDLGFSNGSALSIEGEGVPMLATNTEDNCYINFDGAEKYTGISFSFTGTGFDIISRTGPNQGALRVVVCDAAGIVKKVISVANKGNTDLYQIPVVSAELDAYGTYTVYIFVNAAYDFSSKKDGAPDGNADEFGGAFDRGGEFYFDAVRIYSPINTNATDSDSTYAAALYQIHGEASPIYTEVRDILIDDGSFEAGALVQNGAVYIDATPTAETEFDDEGGRLEGKIAEYKAIGPNNEVYLEKNNAIAFKLEIEGEIPASIDIGAKAVNGTTAELYTLISATTLVEAQAAKTTSIASCTAMYYPQTVSSWASDTQTGKKYVYVLVQNTGEGMLSITDIKLAYSTSVNIASERSATFVIDRQLLNAIGIGNECVMNEVLTPKMSISVGAEMQVFYNISAAEVAGFDNFYLEVVKDVCGNESITTIFSLENENLVPSTNSSGEITRYAATYTGIYAMEMGDSFTATLYAIDQNGTLNCGVPVTASIKSYLLEKLADSATIFELKVLAVDMLNYGAAAQVNFGYDLENLVNADLPDAQKALGTQGIPAAADTAAIDGTGAQITTSISLQNKVMLYLNCSYTKHDDSNLEFVVKDAKTGEELARFAPMLTTSKLCRGSYGDVGAGRMREAITIELYDNGKSVSQTVTWNIESFVARTRASSASSEALIDIVNAMLVYGDSVNAYLLATSNL